MSPRAKLPTSRKPRFNGFNFAPADYLNDPVVVAMSTLARGVYSTLLIAAWELPEPGVVPDDPKVICVMARCTAKEWAQTSAQVRAAFDAKSRPGFLLQKRMRYEHGTQSRKISLWKAAGKRGRAKQLTGLTRASPGPDPGRSRSRSGSRLLDPIVAAQRTGREANQDPGAGVDQGMPAPSPASAAGNGENPSAKLFAWLRSTGTEDQAVATEVCVAAARGQFANPYAYLAPGSKGRSLAEAKARERLADRSKRAEGA